MMTRAGADDAQPRATIRQVLGEETLAIAQDSYLEYLQSAAVIYEADGTRAYAEFRSAYCTLLRRAALQLAQCAAPGSAAPPLCCAGCQAAARQAMASGTIALSECPAGLLIYAAPIQAGGRIVGASAAALGAPPRRAEALASLAARYRVAPELLRAVAESCGPRPASTVEAAQRQIENAAALLGQLYAALTSNVRQYVEQASCLLAGGTPAPPPRASGSLANRERRRASQAMWPLRKTFEVSKDFGSLLGRAPGVGPAHGELPPKPILDQAVWVLPVAAQPGASDETRDQLIHVPETLIPGRRRVLPVA